jgi:DNA-3-methyladenine glycosylase
VKLDRKFFERDTHAVAKALLGKLLVHETKNGFCIGKVVETEAYLGGGDPGAKGNRNVKNAPKALLNPPGHAFVYFTYGNHWMFNVIAKKKGLGAVLIRALEPMAGMALMRKRRETRENKGLTNGPGKLTEAFGISKKQTGADLTSGNLYFTEGPAGKFSVVKTTRIGLAPGKGDKLKLRFYIRGNPFVSRR